MHEIKNQDEEFRKSLESLSFTDLYSMFVFVSGDFNKQFGMKIETKKLIHSRHKIIQHELNKRIYGCDPYAVNKLDISGDKPEDIDLSIYDKKEE